MSKADGRFEKGQPAWNKKPPVERPCLNCGIVFATKPSWARVKCCSNRCKMLYQIKTRGHFRQGVTDGAETVEKKRNAKLFKRGPLCPNYKGYVGKTERQILTAQDEYFQWKLAVVERDGRKCRKCGCGDDLHTHHILPWKQYPERRYDVNNGACLCGPCHREIHKHMHLINGQVHFG